MQLCAPTVDQRDNPIYARRVTSSAGTGLSTHVLNTTSGHPVDGILVRFQILDAGVWVDHHETRTGANGRAHGFTTGFLAAGDYRLVFATGAWFSQHGSACFFPEVTIAFRVDDVPRHHHVPLLLSPFGYTTYRGS